MLVNCMPATECLPLTIKHEMQMMFFRISVSQMAQKLVENHGIDSPQILASLSDEDISVSCEVIRRPGGIVGGCMTGRIKFCYYWQRI